MSKKDPEAGSYAAIVIDPPSEPEMDYEELVLRTNSMARPLADEKLMSKIYKTIRKAAKEKSVRCGVRAVVKQIRKDPKGFIILAGDVSPMDIISHIPILCEDAHLPYCFVPSKRALGEATMSKRSCCALMVLPNDNLTKYFNRCQAAVRQLPLPI